MKNVSVIVVNYNTGSLLYKCIESIYKYTQSISFEILIIDNNSTDNSLKSIESNFYAIEYPEIKIIKNNENLGFAKANNIGIKKASGKYVFLLNPDTELINNSLKIFFDLMEKEENTKVACCGGILINPDESIQESFGNFPSLAQVVVETFHLQHFFQTIYYQKLATGIKKYKKKVQIIDYITGANMFLRKEALEKVNYFDEDFFLYYEDTELCYRLFKNNYQCLFTPNSTIIHNLSSSTKEMGDKKLEIIEKSKYLFFEKSYGKRIKKLVNILYIFKYAFASIYSLNPKYSFLLKLNLQVLRKSDKIVK